MMVHRGWLLLLLTGLLVFAAAPEAVAHGGNFRTNNPAPDAPPRIPDPPYVPGVATPTVPPPELDVEPTAGRHGGHSRIGRLTPFDWPVWWALNQDSLLPTRRPARSLRVGPITPSATGRSLPFDFVLRLRWRRRVDETAKRVAVPFFVALLDAKPPEAPGIVSAALLALARSARSTVAIPYLRRYAFDRRAHPEVRESAVIGMGLTRRTRQGEQLPLDDLIVLRRDLLRLFLDKKCPTQLRAFALYSLALLADQPYGCCVTARYGRDITRSLALALREKYANDELPIALLIALGHQPCAGVSSSLLEELKNLALRRYAFGRKWGVLGASHAVQALACLSAPQAVHVATTLLRSRRMPAIVQAAAVTALAERARTLAPEERVQVAETIQRALVRLHRSRVYRIGLLALGGIIEHDLANDSDAILTECKVSQFLLRALKHGSSDERPFAALALGVAVQHVRPTTRPRLAFATEVRRALARGLDHARGADATVIAAYAAAAGIAHATEARPALLKTLRDSNRHHMLRGLAAVALAQLGERDVEVVTALLDAARERKHPWVHVNAVRALAILGAMGSAEDLLNQFKGRKTRGALVAVAASLGQLGDPRATERLVQMARDRGASRGVRIASVVGLGLLFDREERPSRTRLSHHLPFMALTGTLSRYLDVR